MEPQKLAEWIAQAQEKFGVATAGLDSFLDRIDGLILFATQSLPDYLRQAIDFIVRILEAIRGLLPS